MLISSSHFQASLANHTSPRTRGFTLIELLVVIAIMAIITTILLLRQQQFDSSILLRSLAYSAALSIRQAQTYGVSVQGESASGSTVFASAYGAYFSSGTPTSYFLFADTNSSGQYDSGDKIVQTFTLGPGYTITNFCAGSQCSSNRTITSLTVIFSRPNPDACFATNLDSGACVPGEYSSASIQFSSQGGSTRSVTISPTGEIAVGIVGS